jgi:RNA polymerase sigma-70 factor, ECF subfamily
MLQAVIRENELVLLAQTGNDQALEELVKINLPAVYRLCLGILHDEDLAQDAAQDAFVKVWRNLKKIDPQGNFRGWVMEIAKNTSLDYLKKKKATPFSAFETEDGANALLETVASDSASPAELAENSLLRELLDKATSRLSPAYQKVLNLYYQKGLNFREISEEISEPLHTVKSRHRRAISNLRLILDENRTKD